MPEKPFEISEEDFIKTLLDYEMFNQGIDVNEFENKLINKVIYTSDIVEKEEIISINLHRGLKDDN